MAIPIELFKQIANSELLTDRVKGNVVSFKQSACGTGKGGIGSIGEVSVEYAGMQNNEKKRQKNKFKCFM